MAPRLWFAAAAASLLARAAGLAVHGLEAAGRGALAEAKETPSRLLKAAKDNGALDVQTRAIMSELVRSLLTQADPRIKQEAEIQMLLDLLGKWDNDKDSSIDATDRRVAAFAFRKAIRSHLRRPARAGLPEGSPSQAEARVVEAMENWMKGAKEASQDYLKMEGAMEAWAAEAKRAPRDSEKETQIERLQYLIDKVDPKNASGVADLTAALAQAIRPKRKAARHLGQHGSEVDSKMDETMKSWVDDANKESHDLEKETRSVESDLGDAVPKGKEEKDLERIQDLLDEVDPTNASELADAAAALAQARTRRGQLKPGLEAATGREAATAASANAKAREEVRKWVAQASEATSELDREIDAAIGDLSEEVPKGEEERELERMQVLIDAVDPANTSQVAGLAASLARSSSFARRVGKPPAHPAADWTASDAKKFWDWLSEAEEASEKLDQDLEESEREYVDYLASMTPTQAQAVQAELKTLERIWEKYGFENESATAEDVMHTLDEGGGTEAGERAGEQGSAAPEGVPSAADAAAAATEERHAQTQPEEKEEREAEEVTEEQPPPADLWGDPGAGFCTGRSFFEGPTSGWKDCRERCDYHQCHFWSYWHNSPKHWCKLTAACDHQKQDADYTISSYLIKQP